MTLMKLNNGSGQWEQVENVEDYRNTEQPYRKLTQERASHDAHSPF